MVVVMWQVWGERLRIWRLLCCSIGGWGGRLGCFVAVLGREAEDMEISMRQFQAGV